MSGPGIRKTSLKEKGFSNNRDNAVTVPEPTIDSHSANDLYGNDFYDDEDFDDYLKSRYENEVDDEDEDWF